MAEANSHIEVHEELRTAVKAARAGGMRALDFYGVAAREEKADKSPVTKADTAAQDVIYAHLEGGFDYPILSEEHEDTADRLNADRVWVVDPLDGTSDFLKENGEFVVMIALVREGSPVLGAVYAPAHDTLYYAHIGEGAWRVTPDNGEERLHVSDVAETANATFVMSRSHLSDEEQDVVDALNPRELNRVGSVGLKTAVLATGRGEAYFTLTGKTSQWDTAAPEIVLREAGGELTDIYGERYTYNREEIKNSNGIVATNGKLHEHITNTIANHI